MYDRFAIVSDCISTRGCNQSEYYPGTQWDAYESGFNYGGQWRTAMIYNQSVDPQQYGQTYGLLRRSRIGGVWTISSYCGSRCVATELYSANIHEGSLISSRGCNQGEYCPGAGLGSEHIGFTTYSASIYNTYSSDVDPEKYGYSFGYPRKGMVGGLWNDDQRHIGSRAIDCHLFPAALGSWKNHISTRGCNKRVLS